MIEFINSNENDSISLLCKLIICQPPQIDDDEDDQILFMLYQGNIHITKAKILYFFFFMSQDLKKINQVFS